MDLMEKEKMRLQQVSGIVVSTLALVGLAACDPQSESILIPDLSRETGALSATARSELVAASQGRDERGFEDEILRFENAVPGVGGIFVDVDGSAVVWISDTTRREAVAVYGRKLATNPRIVGPLKRELSYGRVRLKRADFSFSELVAASHDAARLTRGLGVVSIDADESLNRVRIVVSSSVSISKIQEVLAFTNTSRSPFLISVADYPVALSTLRDRHRPTGGGIQIRNANGGRCTLGFNVTTLFFSETAILTAGHCSALGLGTGSTGERIHQNSAVASDSIGRVSINPAWNRTDTDCGGYALCTLADVMMAVSAPTSSWNKRVAQTTGIGTNSTAGSITINSWFSGLSILPFSYVGMDVYKVGRTTGYTLGTLATTCEAVTVSHVGQLYKVLCSNRVNGSAVGTGDSGSPVFYPPAAGDPFYAMGVLFAGGPMNFYDRADATERCTSNCSYYYSPWEQIETHLGRYVRP